MSNYPSGDITPVPTHIVSIADGILPRPVPTTCEIKTITRTLVIAAGDADSYLILPASKKRTRAFIMISSSIGGGTNANSFGWISPNQSDTKHQKGFYVGAPGTLRNFELYGTEAFYFTLDPAASAGILLSIIAEYLNE